MLQDKEGGGAEDAPVCPLAPLPFFCPPTWNSDPCAHIRACVRARMCILCWASRVLPPPDSLFVCIAILLFAQGALVVIGKKDLFYDPNFNRKCLQLISADYPAGACLIADCWLDGCCCWCSVSGAGALAPSSRLALLLLSLVAAAVAWRV